MAKLPQQLHVVHSSQIQSQSIMCDFSGGDHPNGHFTYQNNSPEAKDPSMPERMSKVEDALEKLGVNQGNSMGMIRNIEIQMAKQIKQIA